MHRYRGAELPSTGKRLHRVGHHDDVRRKPNLFVRRYRSDVHLQVECLHADGERLRRRADPRDLHEGRKRLLLRSVDLDVPCPEGLFGYGTECSLLAHLPE